MNKLSPPRTWRELDDLLWQKSRDDTGQFRPYVAFRGLSEDYGNLRTGIQRIGDPNQTFTGEELAVLERRIIETFGTYAREDLPQGFSDWDVLLLGQHYRLPTRLLDWTSSPYVALFFATENTDKLEKDGIIWCVSRVETNSVLPSPLKEYSKDKFGHMFLLETLREKFKGLKDFDKESTDALIWFEPPSRSPRIVNQYAFFSVMPGVDTQQCAWLKKYPEWHWGVPVPGSLKPEVRRRLQVMNITERTIYTGLEGIARWLRAYYSP